MKLNEFFQAVFCITLELGPDAQHPERLLAAKEQFAKHGIEVEFVAGIDGRLLDITEPPSRDGDSVVRKADMGCTLSHLKVVEIAKEQGLINYCVFEDDLILAEDFQKQFKRNIYQLPPFYKMIYLGGDNKKPYHLTGSTPNIVGTHETFTTHAFGAHCSVYNELIRVLSQHEKVDLNISELHKDGGCYIMNPVIAGQRPGWSYILNKEVQNEHDFFKV